MRARLAVLAAGAVLCVASCSDDGGAASPGSTSPDTGSSYEMSPASVPDGPPRVDLIGPAVAALEAQLGAPQEYFEINATPRLVNLFVALSNGTVAQAWVYLDGELSSAEGQPAQGNTFAAADLDFDAAAVLAQVATAVPGASLDSFVVQGDGQGHVQYEVLVTSSKGGGLDVIVGPDGAVKSVDPLN
jgi:hypothetical protein